MEDEKSAEKSLVHYGVPGMKWGIRRYQPYPAGQGHKGRYLGKPVKRKTTVQKAAVPAKKKKPKKQIALTKQVAPKRPKSASTLSDADLRKAIDRLRMEKEYKALTTPQRKEKERSIKKWISDVVYRSTKEVATTQLKRYLSDFLDQKYEVSKDGKKLGGKG